MKQHVTKRDFPVGRGNQLLGARILTVKTDFDALVRQLIMFKFPTLYTLDDLLPICGLSTQADRVHLSRALRRAGISPLRSKKLMLTVGGSRLRAYVWNLGRVREFRSDSDVRKEYYAQHHFDLIEKAQAASLGSPETRPR